MHIQHACMKVAGGLAYNNIQCNKMLGAIALESTLYVLIDTHTIPGVVSDNACGWVALQNQCHIARCYLV